ncbi:MAG: hypothetical protein JRJ66_10645 [Deltaproteobacteria bacterium]|nr:hypothetical protein [Deltaproteobacteria bacterium]
MVLYGGPQILSTFGKKPAQQPEPRLEHEQERAPRLSRGRLQELLLLSKADLFPVSKTYSCEEQGKKLTLETSIDTGLQAFVERLLKRSMTYEAAVVVLNPKSGEILALANHDRSEQRREENLCLKADFPAASIFKIVTAAAAIEAKGFVLGTKLVFRGRRHTLYRSQLKKTAGRYATKTTFEKAFSCSINPVFGKIGIYELGSSLLSEYAERFLFNRRIPFDVPLETSQVEVPEDEYGVAEMASGFNRKTLVSPLHVAFRQGNLQGITLTAGQSRGRKDGTDNNESYESNGV